MTISAREDLTLATNVGIEASAKLHAGGTLNLNQFAAIGEGLSAAADQNRILLAVSSGATVSDKSKFVTPNGSLTVGASSSGPLRFGAGVKLSGLSINVSLAVDVSFGAKSSLLCGATGCTANTGVTRSFGDGFKVGSEGPISLGGGGPATFGIGTKVSGTSITFGQGRALAIGDGAKLSATGTVGLSASSGIQLGNGTGGHLGEANEQPCRRAIRGGG